ncbi:MAG TPA: glycosyltransferase family 2 protein [Geobacteraceae bacterium]
MENMHNDILLTIGIPTHNGSKYIAETIESILKQSGLNSRQVEILIADNASTDSTHEIICQYSKKYPDLLSYFRNDENIGYDRNVDMLFKKAKGAYVEILGDDDFYKNEFCLDKIMKTIKNNVNASVILLSVDFLDIVTHEITNGFRVDKDLIFKNGDSFFSATKWASSAVSSLIIKREVWNKIDVEKYFGSLWIHVGALINVLKGNAESYVIADPIIMVRTNNSRWQEHGGNQLECGLKHLNMFGEMIGLGYLKETYDLFLKDRYKHNFRDTLFLKPNKSAEKRRVTKLMIKYFKNYPLFWMLHVPAMFIPKHVFYPLLFARNPIHFSKKIVYKWKTKRFQLFS